METSQMYQLLERLLTEEQRNRLRELRPEGQAMEDDKAKDEKAHGALLADCLLEGFRRVRK